MEQRQQPQVTGERQTAERRVHSAGGDRKGYGPGIKAESTTTEFSRSMARVLPSASRCSQS